MMTKVKKSAAQKRSEHRAQRASELQRRAQ